jgi:hypothetical protein
VPSELLTTPPMVIRIAFDDRLPVELLEINAA